MLGLNHSLVYRENTLINVLYALSSIFSMRNLNVTMSKFTPRYLALFSNGIFALVIDGDDFLNISNLTPSNRSVGTIRLPAYWTCFKINLRLLPYVKITLCQ